MNAEERQLITDLFERMRSVGPIEKDHDAEQLIIHHARSHPDAGYMLVQNVLVQEQVIQQQQQQIEDLNAEVQRLQAMQRPQPTAQPQSGGFLGGLFGGGARTAASSVPPAGRQAQPQYAPQYAPPPQQPASPWGRAAAPQAPQGRYAQGMTPQAAPAAPAGGGFMRSAMATAAGVAGGMLAANAIAGMMRGDSGSAAQTASTDPNLGNNDPGAGQTDAASYSGQGAAEQQYVDETNDPGNFTETSDTSWDGGGDVEL